MGNFESKFSEIETITNKWWLIKSESIKNLNSWFLIQNRIYRWKNDSSDITSLWRHKLNFISALFGNDKIKVNQSILGELDQLIGDFLELSGQQYVVSTTLTVHDHSVLVEETESLENVTNRTGFDPHFLQKPLPAESNGEGKQFNSFDLSLPHLTF